MSTWLVYWRTEQFQTVLYGFPRPGHKAPVLARMDDETDCQETRAILIEQLERQSGVKIHVLEER